MRDAFLDFEWPVAFGYEWQDWLGADGTPQRVMVSAADCASDTAVEHAWRQSGAGRTETGPVLAALLGKGEEQRRYRPLDKRHAALFREFADVDYANSGQILAFATKYGHLGLPVQHQSLVIRGRLGKRREHSAHGEPYLGWAIEIVRMRQGLKLAERCVTFAEKRHLKSLVDPHLQHVRGRLSFDRSGAPRMAFEPLTLISAMWLQLASAVTVGKRFLACKFCRRPFEISTEDSGFRSHRQFCSDSCKTRDARYRKRKAIELSDGGLPVAAIADQVLTPPETIERWLSERSMRKKEKR